MLYAYIETFAIRDAPVNLLVILPLAAALIVICAQRGAPWRTYVTAATVALGWTLLLASITTMSWGVAAWKHSLVHSHVNWITMYMFFLPFAAIASVEALRIALHRSWSGPPSRYESALLTL
jgi:hypothetical protein